MEGLSSDSVLNQQPGQFKEGGFARPIENVTARFPSDLFLWLAGGAILGSLMLQVMDRKENSLFVGQWAPTFLIMGLYNKLVKVAGHDSADRENRASNPIH